MSLSTDFWRSARNSWIQAIRADRQKFVLMASFLLRLEGHFKASRAGRGQQKWPRMGRGGKDAR
eukprot:6170967-Pyramimonas_sp.AAC.1